MSDAHIGPYEIIDRIGEGGMGVVYRGRDSTSGACVAVKTARSENRHALSSLRSEIEALARIRHASIVRILDHGAKDGVPWYAMELLEGETWEDYKIILWPPLFEAGPPSQGQSAGESQAFDATVPRRGARASTPAPVPAAEQSVVDTTIRYSGERRAQIKPKAGAGQLLEVLSRARKLCTALTVLHEAGFVHRDLKPSNVFLVDGRPVLTDLGIVSRFRGAVGRERIEVSGRLMGTVRYMAPEQAQGQLVDARADLYAFGMMLFETITGRLPFSASTADAWLEAVLHKPAPALSAFVEDVPPELDELVASLLRREPRERIGHADDVARMLELLGAEPDALAPSSTRTYLYRPQMAGRESPRLVLEQAIARTQMGLGELVLIGGESGVGKTVLASEAAREATLRGLSVVTGECLPINLGNYTAVDLQSSPLHPLRPLLEHTVDLCQTGGEAITQRLLGEGRGKVLAAYEPSLAQLPGVAAQSIQELPGELAQRRLLETMKVLLQSLVLETGPLLLLIDDLQWADEITRTLLAYLADGDLATMKVLIVGTYRADEVQPSLAELRDRSSVRRIDLERLDEQSVGSMVSDMLALRQPPPGFVAFLTRHSEGNPFFVAEYLRLAAAEQLLRREDGHWTFEVDEDTAEAYQRLSLPDSLKDLVERRLKGLSKRARDLLEVASVLGRETDRALLVAVAGGDDDAMDDAIGQLVVRQILEAESGVFRFAHDKLRETTYAAIPEARRRDLNRAAAVAMESRATSPDDPVDHGRLAHFWSEAEVWPKAVDALEKSAQSALQEYANEQAIGIFQSVFEICEREGIDVGSTRRGQWQRGLAEASSALGRDFQGRRHLEQALVHLGQPALPEGGFAQGLAMCKELSLLILQNYLRPLFRFKSGLARVRTAESAIAYNRLLENMLRNNETVLAVYANMRNVRLAERVPPRPALARGYAMLSYITCLTPLQGVAARIARRALKVAEDLGSEATIAYVITRVMAYQETVGLWGDAQAGAERALEIAHRLGDSKQVDEVHQTRGVGLYVEGRFEDRLQGLQACLESAIERGDSMYEGFSRSGLMECYVRLGMDAEAKANLPELERWGRGEREQSEAVWAHGAAAMAAWHLADEHKARAEADRALALMRQSPPQVFLLTPPLWELCEFYMALAERNADATHADAAVVRGHLEELVAIFNKFAALIRAARPYAKLAEAGLAWRSGRAAKASQLWQQALTMAEAMQAKHAQARACYELGRHAEGEMRTRRLDEAIRLFEEMQTKPELARAREAKASGRVAL